MSFHIVSVVVGFGAALWVGVAAAALADPFTLSNACLEDREACLSALDGQAPPPAPEVVLQAVVDAPGPIRLSNRHIGMSRDELAALGVVKDEEPAPETVEVVEDRPFREEPENAAPAAEAALEPEPVQEVGFTSCVEASVRAGNGLQESVRVCRSVFMN